MKRGPYKKYLKINDIPIPGRTVHRHLIEAIIERRKSYKQYLRANNIAIPKRTEHRRHLKENIEANEENRNNRFRNVQVEGMNDVDNDRPILVDNNDDVIHFNMNQQNIEQNTINNTDDNGTTDSDWSDIHHNESDLIDDDESEIFHDAIEENLEPFIPQERIPLYNDCDLTKEESELLIMAFTVRHGLSDYALKDLLELVNCHLPYAQHISKYLFLKKFTPLVTIIPHFYCPECKNNILKFVDAALLGRCDDCKRDYSKDDLKKKGSYFLQLPLDKQLTRIMNSQLYYKLSKDRINQSDVVNGRVYRKMMEEQVITEQDITLQWNTDGVQVFNSSKASFWPIQVSINELPYRLRRENIMLCGLWYGPDKPVMDIFLKPFVEELITLHNNGIECITPQNPEGIKIKVHTLIASVDSVARPLLQNIKQFNGEFGCSFCLKKGDRVPIRRGYTRTYCGDVGIRRTSEQHITDCAEAIETNSPVRGVKGPSILMLLPVFNIIHSFVPDYMHSILLGVTKTFVCNIWLNPVYSDNRPWYIGNKIKEIDETLLNIKPPCEVTRTPRSIQDRQLWKASEWKNFLLYYSLLCVLDIIPPVYAKHWSLLVFSMHIYLKDKIDKNELKIAKKALQKFVFKVETLYGQEFVKFNVHLLLHIPEAVLNFGSLWAHSTFPYEHFNGILGKLFQNSQVVPKQICKSYLRLKTVDKISNTAFSHENCAVRAKTLFNRMLGSRKINLCVDYGPHLRLLGSSVNITLSITEQVSITELLQEDIVANDVQSYKRFIFKGILYHSTNYERLRKRENSTAQLTNGTYILITKILMIRKINSNNYICIIVGNKFLSLNLELPKDSEIQNSSKIYSSIVRKTEQITCILPESLKTKCIKIDYNSQRNQCIIMPLVNSTEID
ncbi:uncharacterized protein LOC105204984 isoform X2 [Solenopsis invicta]|uniref:uncharacterized protein LOC105204984 isoform X2 n=1 Tax=Solenopsis invicta TaxID=13686 RepID=UPI00193E8009|nr:uncharacterized protein LOC105204984 isoform X2 [Solenopsis invicta]